MEEFRRVYLGAFDRDDPEAKPPKSEILNYLAGFRMEPAPEDDSSADEEVPEKGAGWRGTSPPMSGEGYATREHCDGVLGIARSMAGGMEALPRDPTVEGYLESLHEIRGSSWDTTAAYGVGAREGQELPIPR